MSKTKENLDLFIKFIEEENGEKLEGIVDEVISILLSNFALDISSAIEGCESPIEKAFSLHLRRYMEMSYLGKRIDEVFEYLTQETIEIRDKKYRVDFLVEYANQKYEYAQKFVIECDGHEFHEKTKEQAANDRQRERDLLGEGYIVIRFTGSEIYKAPAKCAREAISIIRNYVTNGMNYHKK